MTAETQSSTASPTEPSAAPSSAASPPPPVRARRSVWPIVALVAAVVALAGVAWNWYDARKELGDIREELAKRMRESGNEAREARVLAREAQEAAREVQGKAGALEAKLLESQSQQVALEALYQELSRSRDDWVLAEVEQTLTIAAQQLQLAGNVQAALLALQTVDARLARSDRPQFIPLRKVIGRDIEKLKSAPNLDVAGMTLRIDQVLNNVDTLPLLVEGRPQAEPGDSTVPAAAPWWERFGRAAWEEIKQLVRVQRLDAVDQSLLSPEQRYFLRENLKLRLMHARLALLQRDEAAFRSDLKASVAWLNRYFDAREKPVSSAIVSLSQLNNAAVDVELPSIADSLSAVRTFKMPRDRATRQP